MDLLIILSMCAATAIIGFIVGRRMGIDDRDNEWTEHAWNDEPMKVNGANYYVLPVNPDIIERYRVGSRQIKD